MIFLLFCVLVLGRVFVLDVFWRKRVGEKSRIEARTKKWEWIGFVAFVFYRMLRSRVLRLRPISHRAISIPKSCFGIFFVM